MQAGFERRGRSSRLCGLQIGDARGTPNLNVRKVLPNPQTLANKETAGRVCCRPSEFFSQR